MTVAERNSIVRKSFPVGPLQCNCTIIGDTLTGKAIVVDPGGDADVILNTLKAMNLSVVAIIHTHAHLDHILAAGEIQKATGAPIHLHEDDMFLWDEVEAHCRRFGLPPVKLPPPDKYLKDDQDLGCCGGVTLHTPGHTPGSTSFWFEDANLLIAGDTLFLGSIGRTDFPGGNFEQIVKSIRERIYTLDEGAEVVTGHGPETTIGQEKYHNQFVRA
ncbi:MAG: MBL fold metallo-hydrolase [Porticoccaceae bacterium]|nr:MBL fold metallo-hydrolase [Porticoccaceae bacterium]